MPPYAVFLFPEKKYAMNEQTHRNLPNSGNISLRDCVLKSLLSFKSRKSFLNWAFYQFDKNGNIIIIWVSYILNLWVTETYFF